MKAKLVIENNGKKEEFDIEISDPKLRELVAPKKQTGYERMAKGEDYYVNEYYADKVCRKTEQILPVNDERYESANYYSDKSVAENNARADKLMRQLRRFAVEHREKDIDWKNIEQNKYSIYYDCKYPGFFINELHCARSFGFIPFDSNETAQLAIETFYDELIWYFTEYKDSL